MCRDKSNLGIVRSLLEIHDLLATRPWLIADGWFTTAYTAAQLTTILASPRTCRSTEVIDSLCVGIDLGISIRMLVISLTHFLNFLFNIWGISVSQESFLSYGSR